MENEYFRFSKNQIDYVRKITTRASRGNQEH